MAGDNLKWFNVSVRNEHKWIQGPVIVGLESKSSLCIWEKGMDFMSQGTLCYIDKLCLYTVCPLCLCIFLHSNLVAV